MSKKLKHMPEKTSVKNKEEIAKKNTSDKKSRTNKALPQIGSLEDRSTVGTSVSADSIGGVQTKPEEE